MGRPLGRSHKHNHSRIHADSACNRCLRNRCRTTQGVYGKTLEELILLVGSSDDLGAPHFLKPHYFLSEQLQGWFVSAGLIYALIPRLNFLSSLAVAACLTPTDPILAAAVVGGKWANKHVPEHIRHLLAAESGCNDGAAFPFLFISLYLIIDKNIGQAIKDWVLILWLCKCFPVPLSDSL